MQVTGPFPLAANTPITLTQPANYQIAVTIQNISPYELEVEVSNKTYAIAPLTEVVIPVPSSVQNLLVTPIPLSGTVPAGSNADLVAVWYDANDDLSTLAVNHPISLSANAVATGSSVTGDVVITGPLSSQGFVEVDVSATVPLPVETLSSTGTLTQIAPSTASVEVLAANTSRKGFLLCNNDTDTVYIAFSAAASLTAFTLELATGATYEAGSVVYQGEITAIWATAGTGSLQVTELT